MATEQEEFAVMMEALYESIDEARESGFNVTVTISLPNGKIHSHVLIPKAEG